MSNQLNLVETSFLYTQREIRTAADEAGNPWFCAKDIFDVLGIYWNGEASLKNMPNSWFMVVNITTIKGERDTIFINEAGVYRTIFRSDKPEAERFSQWICAEVIPELRKHGYYGTLTFTPGQAVQMTGLILKLARDLASTKDAFLFKLYQDRLHAACAMLGQPVPDYNLLGKDRFQLGLDLGVQS